MELRPKVGLLLIGWAALVFCGGEAWLSTREPVFMEGTISASEITAETNEFSVTYSTDYYLMVAGAESDWHPIDARWTLLCDGNVRSSGRIGESSTWAWIPHPTGAAVCRLKLDVDSAHGPLRLSVGTVGTPLEDIHANVLSCSSAFFLFGCALTLLIPENKPSRVLRPAVFGLLASAILIPLVIIITLPSSVHASHGLWLKPPPRNYDQRWNPLVLRIESASHWTLNGAPVSKAQLPELLRSKFSHRPDWVLELEADPNLEMHVVVRIVDWLQGMGIRTVLGKAKGGFTRSIQSHKSAPESNDRRN